VIARIGRTLRILAGDAWREFRGPLLALTEIGLLLLAVSAFLGWITAPMDPNPTTPLLWRGFFLGSMGFTAVLTLRLVCIAICGTCCAIHTAWLRAWDREGER
jgi:hypothetical protein